MKAVYSRELRSYFTGLTGCVFAAFMLLFAGIFTMVYNLNYSYANFEYAMGNMPFVFLVIVPIITMRTFAAEKRGHTDVLLYSLPVSMTRVVMGKYLALLAVGMFISSLTESQAVAAGVSFAVLLLNYFLAELSENLSSFSLFERYYEFMNGVFSLNTIVFYATVAGVFCFLTVQSMEKRRWA